MWWIAAAAAAELVLTEGEPWLPGVPARVEHAAPGGRTVLLSSTSGAAIRALPRRGDVWSWEVIPPLDAEQVGLLVDVDGRLERATVAVAVPVPGPLTVPARLDLLSSEREVTLSVGGVGPVGTAIEVATSEGEPIAWDVGTDGTGVLTLRLADDNNARNVVVGVRRRDLDARPVWTTARVRARRALPFVTEPGAALTLAVGGRSYGPFQADPSGRIDATVDQYPGETRALAALSDDLGNETRSEVALGAGAGTTIAVAASMVVRRGEPLPPVWVRAVHADGGAATAPPACQTRLGPVALRAVGPGTWFGVVLDDAPVLDDVRVDCAYPGERTQTARLAARLGLPHHVDLRVWPDELGTAAPTAEVRAALEDALGARLLAPGVTLTADAGGVSMHAPTEAGVAAGEYDGTPAVPAGRDWVRASWRPEPSTEPVALLRLAWDAVPATGSVLLWALAQDVDGRPVRGAEVAFRIGAEAQLANTGDDGWASARLALPAGGAPMVAEVRCQGRVRRGGLVRETVAVGEPGGPILAAAHAVTLSTGRAYGLALTVDPPVLRAGPGSFAVVSVQVEDRTGAAVTDEAPALTASQGRLGPVQLRGDRWVAEWHPDGVHRATRVSLSANAGEVRGETALDVAPRAVTPVLGAWVGGVSNFGAVNGPIFGLDVDLRLRSGWLRDAFGVRIGAATYGWTSEVSTGAGLPVTVANAVVPLTLALGLQRERGVWLLSAQAGASLGLHRIDARVGARPLASGVDLLFGPTLGGGVCWRTLGGEVGMDARGWYLPAAPGEIAYSGNVGGLALGATYRLRF
jgi:hypothetical protein